MVMRYAKILIILCLLLSCISCVSTQTVANNFGNQWLGRNKDDFARRYGMPYKQYPFQDGETIYVWDSRQQRDNPGIANVFCEMRLTTDQSGLIREIIITRDTIGLLTTSRCYEVLEAQD